MSDVTKDKLKSLFKLSPGYDLESLPTYKYRDEIIDTFSSNNISLFSASTGSGKSTLVPIFLLNYLYSLKNEIMNGRFLSGREKLPLIYVTQPRRLAAIQLADRIAKSLGFKSVRDRRNNAVGYCISGRKAGSTRQGIVFVTAGWLVELLSHKPSSMSQVDCIIIDEAHEATLDTHLLVLIGTQAATRRLGPSITLKLVVMSATLDADMFNRFFSQYLPRKAIPQSFSIGTSPYSVMHVYFNEIYVYSCSVLSSLGFRIRNIVYQDRDDLLEEIEEMKDPHSLLFSFEMKIDMKKNIELQHAPKMNDGSSTTSKNDHRKQLKDCENEHISNKERFEEDAIRSTSVLSQRSILRVYNGLKELSERFNEVQELIAPRKNKNPSGWKKQYSFIIQLMYRLCICLAQQWYVEDLIIDIEHEHSITPRLVPYSTIPSARSGVLSEECGKSSPPTRRSSKGHTILCFLPGEKEQHQLLAMLDKYSRDNIEQHHFENHIKLHSLMAYKQQQKVFLPVQRDRTRIIAATNIAESSITVPSVRAVVDCGFERSVFGNGLSEEDPEFRTCGSSGIKYSKEFRTQECSMSSSAQRAGRAGRVSDGMYFACLNRTGFADFQPCEEELGTIEKALLRILSLESFVKRDSMFYEEEEDEDEEFSIEISPTGLTSDLQYRSGSDTDLNIQDVEAEASSGNKDKEEEEEDHMQMCGNTVYSSRLPQGSYPDAISILTSLPNTPLLSICVLALQHLLETQAERILPIIEKDVDNIFGRSVKYVMLDENKEETGLVDVAGFYITNFGRAVLAFPGNLSGAHLSYMCACLGSPTLGCVIGACDDTTWLVNTHDYYEIPEKGFSLANSLFKSYSSEKFEALTSYNAARYVESSIHASYGRSILSKGMLSDIFVGLSVVQLAQTN
ncbi:hypothetical protein ADUPG1_010317, partial [Aduncisulcus paluster]